MLLASVAQAAAQRFADNFEALLQRIAADPLAPLPGFEHERVNCISISALRCVCLRAVLWNVRVVGFVGPSTVFADLVHSHLYCPVLYHRDRYLRAEGFRDAFRAVKAKENAKSLALLPSILRCAGSAVPQSSSAKQFRKPTCIAIRA